MSADGLPPGVVGVLGRDVARFQLFTESLRGLLLPSRSTFEFVNGTSIPDNRNEIVKATLERPDAEWMIQLDDDMWYPQDFVLRMVERALVDDLDVVGPLYVERLPPFRPVSFRTIRPQRRMLDGEPDGGLFEVEGTGAGGLLVRRRVLEAVEPPWFVGGALPGEAWQSAEDLWFCLKAREAGFRVMVDASVPVGHIGLAMFFPRFEDGEWGVMVHYGQGYASFMGYSGIEGAQDPESVT